MLKVSIIIPVFNAQKTIQRAIDSVLNQDFPQKDFKLIVVNDGSTDKTLEILKSYGKKIKIINQQNQGAVKAANRGLEESQSKYLIKIDSDDYFKPNILKEMAAILDKKPEIDFIYCDYYEKFPQGKLKIISTKNNIFNTIAGGIMFRKNKLAKEGFYNEDIKFPEYDLLLKVENKWRGYHIAKPLYYYNRRRESLTGKKQWLKEALVELKKLHPQKIKKIQKIRKY